MNDANHITALLKSARQAFQRNDLSPAYEFYLQVIDLAPANTVALLEMGQLCVTMGNHDEASNAFQRTIELEPNNASGHYMKGSLNLVQGNYMQAIDSLQKTLHLNPEFIEAYESLGLAFYHLEQYKEAAENYETCLKPQPDKVSVIYNLGLVRKAQRRYKDAESLFRRALSLAPNSAEIHNSLGYILNLLNNLTAAEKHNKIAIKLHSGFADAHFNLGTVLFAMFKFCDAERSFLQTLQLDPQHALAENSLASILVIQGEVEKAEQHYRNALSINNGANAHSNLLLCMHYRSHYNRDAIFSEHRLWCAQHATKSAIRHNNTDADPEKILHVGYLSANYCQHSVAYFLEAIFRRTNQNNVKIYCYSDTARNDAYTDIFQKYATVWRQISSVSNARLAKQIKKDRIDILVDLAGHTDMGHDRLGLFALKPAPVQVTYLGYPDTTGLHTMDYRLTDSVADPSGSEKWHSESLAYLETGFLCYTPPRDAPPIALLPATKNNFVTFGSFNNLVKISPETLDAWTRILQRVPNSRLLIKSKAFFDPEMIDRYRARLTRNSIDISRFEMIGWTVNTDDHLGLYGKVDIALDPFPYNGTTTTCEALWMGVPVITLLGDRHCSRVGASLLTSAGLTQLIADNIDDYIDMAVELASDTQELSRLRASLRGDVADSHLHNSEHFTRQLEACYRDMWRNWCDQI